MICQKKSTFVNRIIVQFRHETNFPRNRRPVLHRGRLRTRRGTHPPFRIRPVRHPRRRRCAQPEKHRQIPGFRPRTSERRGRGARNRECGQSSERLVRLVHLPGIRSWVESLPTKSISMATLANSYRIIGL